MKVAILISGQPRNYKQGYEELKKAYLDRYDCDIFFHTWDSNTFTATRFFVDRPQNTYTYPDGWIYDVISLYKPKKYKIEKPKQFDPQNIIDPVWRQPLQNTKSMWYSVYRAFELVDNTYDAYIRTRFDLKYESSTLNLESLDMTAINVWDWDTDIRVKNRGYYDVFAVGGHDEMGIYSSLYTKVDWYLNFDREYVTFLGGDSGLRNEYLLRWHLMSSGVPVTTHQNRIPHADGHIIR